jgi:hypothetical protein
MNSADKHYKLDTTSNQKYPTILKPKNSKAFFDAKLKNYLRRRELTDR